MRREQQRTAHGALYGVQQKTRAACGMTIPGALLLPPIATQTTPKLTHLPFNLASGQGLSSTSVTPVA